MVSDSQSRLLWAQTSAQVLHVPPPAGVSGSQPSRSPRAASAYLPLMVNSEGSKSKPAGSLLVQGERAPGTSPGNPLRMPLQLLLSPSMMRKKKSRFGCLHTFGGEEVNPTLQVHRQPWCTATSCHRCRCVPKASARKLPQVRPSRLCGKGCGDAHRAGPGGVRPSARGDARSRCPACRARRGCPSPAAEGRRQKRRGQKAEWQWEVERGMSREERKGRGKKGMNGKRGGRGGANTAGGVKQSLRMSSEPASSLQVPPGDRYPVCGAGERCSKVMVKSMCLRMMTLE